MRHKKNSFLFGFSLFFGLACATPEPLTHPHIKKRFVLAIERLKKNFENDPQNPLSKDLYINDSIQTHVDTQLIIEVANDLEKDMRIKPLAEKITAKMTPNQELLKKCFIEGDEKSCTQFERLLKSSTFKCSSWRCICLNRSMCEAAAFVAVAKCLEVLIK